MYCMHLMQCWRISIYNRVYVSLTYVWLKSRSPSLDDHSFKVKKAQQEYSLHHAATRYIMLDPFLRNSMLQLLQDVQRIEDATGMHKNIGCKYFFMDMKCVLYYKLNQQQGNSKHHHSPLRTSVLLISHLFIQTCVCVCVCRHGAMQLRNSTMVQYDE